MLEPCLLQPCVHVAGISATQQEVDLRPAGPGRPGAPRARVLRRGGVSEPF